MTHYAIVRGHQVNKAWDMPYAFGGDAQMLIRCTSKGKYLLTDCSRLLYPSEVFKMLRSGKEVMVHQPVKKSRKSTRK